MELYNEKLGEQTQEMAEYKERQELELHRLELELKRRDDRRRDLLGRVEIGGSESLQQLNYAENKCDELKKKIQQFKHESMDELRRMRLQIYQLKSETEDALKQQLRDLRREQDDIQNDRIPQLEQELIELRDRQGKLKSEILILTGRLSDLNRYDLETVDLELNSRLPHQR
ncbi:hypothetical protein JXA32_10160 [Candidatus Sumerlaeota bacterium]|nr:hypothetical protein [Candidatus Sumerlaeota bacterium]